MTHEVHLHFTCFDAPQASNLELLAHLNTIGLVYSQPPQWKPGKVKKIIASVPTMTELLWQYLLQAAICKDGIAMAIAMDKHQEEDAQDFFCHGALSKFGRETLTAADIPNKVQSNLRDKDIHVKIRPRESEHWYRALLINGMVELCFRSADDMKRYEELPITEKPFLITTTGSTKRMLGAVSSTGKEASLAPLGRYKLDLLFIPLETSLTKIETLLKEGDITWSGMERHAMGKGADGAPTTSKVTIGFDEEPDMARCSQAVYGTFRPEIKRRGEILCSIQYDVPRHHCYKCYYPDKPKESYGHNGKDCTKETVCDVCHEPHATTGCGWIREKKSVVQHRHDIIPESVYLARNAARDAAFIQQGAQWGSSAGSMYGGSQAGGTAWGNTSEVGSVIYPGDSPTQPSRTMPQRAVAYREDSPMGYRGPPSPVRSSEDVFATRSAGQDWTTSGYVPTQADYERIRSTSRQGRAATDADDRYNAARDASNVTQMTPVGLDFNSRWDPDVPYMPTLTRGAADAQQPPSPPRRPAQERPGRVNLSRPRRRCTPIHTVPNSNGINRNQPLRIAVVWDVPQGYCRNCYNPDNAASFSQGHSRGGKNKKKCPNMDNICPICKSTDHAIINCPFEETKLIAVKKENVMYEAPTLSAAALAGRDQEKAKAKSVKAASVRSYGSLSLNRLRGYNASSSDEDPGSIYSPYYSTELTISQRPNLRLPTKRTSGRPSVSQSTLNPHFYLIGLLALTSLLIGYKPHLIPSLLLVLLLAAACASPTAPLTPPPSQPIRLLPLPTLHFLVSQPVQPPPSCHSPAPKPTPCTYGRYHFPPSGHSSHYVLCTTEPHPSLQVEPYIPPIIMTLIKLSPLLLISPSALPLPLLCLLPTSPSSILLMTLTLLPHTQAVDPMLVTGASAAVGHQATSILASAWVKLITSTEVAEDNIATSTANSSTGHLVQDRTNKFVIQTQNVSGGITNAHTFSAILQQLEFDQPDAYIATEAGKDCSPERLQFLHRKMTPTPDTELEYLSNFHSELPYTIFSCTTQAEGERGGVVLFLHNKYRSRVIGKPTYDINGRWLSVDIRTPKGRTTLIAAYLPPNPQQSTAAKEAWANLQDYITSRHVKKRTVFLGGDLNASLNLPLQRKTVGDTHRGQHRLLSLLTDHSGLTDTFPHCNPDLQYKTFSNHTSWTSPDHILISSHTSQDATCSQTSTTTARLHGFDHSLLTTYINIDEPVDIPKHDRTRIYFDKDRIQEYKEALDQAVLDIPHDLSPADTSKCFFDLCIKIATDLFTTIRTSLSPSKKSTQVLKMWNDLQAINTTIYNTKHNAVTPNRILQRKIFQGCDMSLTELTTLRTSVKALLNSKGRRRAALTTRLFTQRRSQWFTQKRLGKFLSSALSTNTTWFGGVQSTIDPATGAVSSDPTKTKELATKRISSTFFSPRIEIPTFITDASREAWEKMPQNFRSTFKNIKEQKVDPDLRHCMDQVTPSELRAALKRFGKNKSPGPSGLTAEMLLHANGAPPKMENTPRSLTTSDSVRHSTPFLSFDKNDSNALKSLPITPSFTKLNPSALIFQPKLHFSASTSNFQSSSQLRSSSQPFLRQLTLILLQPLSLLPKLSFMTPLVRRLPNSPSPPPLTN